MGLFGHLEEPQLGEVNSRVLVRFGLAGPTAEKVLQLSFFFLPALGAFSARGSDCRRV